MDNGKCRKEFQVYCIQSDSIFQGEKVFRLALKNSDSPNAPMQLNLHFASGLNQETSELLRKYAELSFSSLSSTDKELKVLTEYNKLQFHELCKRIDSKLYVASLCELSTCLWKISANYNKIHLWHTNQLAVDGFDSVSAASFEQKLQYGRTRLWQDVQIKIRTLLSSFQVWLLSIDELLDMLDILKTLVEMGKQFCQSNSDVLRECVRQQSINYFRGFHRGKLDELRVFLENESWEPCPVPSNFNVFHLIEFRVLNQSKLTSSNSESTSNNEQFYLMDTTTSPFSSRGSASFEERISGCSSDHSNFSENVCGFSEERKTESGTTEPLLANTTLSVLRLFGRYIHFMHLLKTIAFDVLICLNQLFEYYLYAVYKLFGTNSAMDAMSPKLRSVLTETEETLIDTAIRETGDSIQDTTAFSSSIGEKVACPKVCLPIQMDQPNQLYGLKLRLIAAESVIFLARQLELLRPDLLTLIPSSKEPKLHQFFSQTSSVAHDLRVPIFSCVACRHLDSEHITNMMSRVQWEVKEVMSQHSSYVDHMLQVLGDYDASVFRVVCHPQTLPPEVYNILWDQIIRLCYRVLLDGFSAVRKCSNEGRALMQLDLRHFQVKIESLTRLRPLPDASIVETFIKAYYLPESALKKWIQEQKDYSRRQMMNLIQCVSQGSKKTRLNLISFMEDLNRR